MSSAKLDKSESLFRKVYIVPVPVSLRNRFTNFEDEFIEPPDAFGPPTNQAFEAFPVIYETRQLNRFSFMKNYLRMKYYQRKILPMLMAQNMDF